MKHLSILLAAVAAVCLPASSAPADDDYKGSWDTDAVYLVIASDAPASMRRGGPNVWLCDGTADDVQIQAAINEAELEAYEPTVVLSPGLFKLTAPIRLGWNNNKPYQQGTCTLRGAPGNTYLLWNGSDSTDLSKFMLNCGGPSDYGNRVKDLHLDCSTKLSGIYVDHGNRTTVENVYLENSKYFGLAAVDCWFFRVSRVPIRNGTGMGALFLRADGVATRSM